MSLNAFSDIGNGTIQTQDAYRQRLDNSKRPLLEVSIKFDPDRVALPARLTSETYQKFRKKASMSTPGRYKAARSVVEKVETGMGITEALNACKCHSAWFNSYIWMDEPEIMELWKRFFIARAKQKHDEMVRQIILLEEGITIMEQEGVRALDASERVFGNKHFLIPCMRRYQNYDNGSLHKRYQEVVEYRRIHKIKEKHLGEEIPWDYPS